MDEHYMRAMILAAGRGERMRPLTDTVPKPLLKVGDKSLIEHHIHKLKAIGITEIVINHAWLGHVIEATLGDGSQYGVNISYSPEEPGGLETAGGIRHALHLLGDEQFIVVNGDVYTEFDYTKLLNNDLGDNLGKLFLVDNPSHNKKGDFGISKGYLTMEREFTFSGVAIYHPNAFTGIPDERAPLRPYFEKWIEKHKLLAEKMECYWCDVGTPERLASLNEMVRLNNR